MKRFLVSLAAVFSVLILNAQNAPAYTMPGTYNFDYTVTQSVSGKKTGDSTTFHLFYTKSGEYAAAEFSGRNNQKGNLFIVLTRMGNVVVFNERDKTITVLNPRKLMMDMAATLMKYIRMDSLMAHMKMKSDKKDIQSVKSGRTKSLGAYTSEEYTVTSQKKMGSVWIAKVDFPTQSDYLMNMIGSGMMPMMDKNLSSHPLMQAMMQSKSLVTEIQMQDSIGNRGLSLHTINLQNVASSVSTNGYTVNDYSNMNLHEIFEAEMKRRNN